MSHPLPAASVAHCRMLAEATRQWALLAAFCVFVVTVQGIFRLAAFVEKPFGPRDPHAADFY